MVKSFAVPKCRVGLWTFCLDSVGAVDLRFWSFSAPGPVPGAISGPRPRRLGPRTVVPRSKSGLSDLGPGGPGSWILAQVVRAQGSLFLVLGSRSWFPGLGAGS